jgi:hypothetical protein
MIHYFNVSIVFLKSRVRLENALVKPAEENQLLDLVYQIYHISSSSFEDTFNSLEFAMKNILDTDPT